jgi:integrase
MLGKMFQFARERRRATGVTVNPVRGPLVGRVVAMLRRRRDTAGDRGHVFPGRRRGQPLTTISKAHAAVVKACGFSFQLRDLRRTVGTRLGEHAGRFVVKLALNHVDSDGVTPTYDRFDYVKQMKQALERWDRSLTAIVEGAAATSKVIQLAHS